MACVMRGWWRENREEGACRLNHDTLRTQFATRVLENKEYRHWVLESLYDHQTPNEQLGRVTRDRNGKGFSGPDAPILSPIAEKLTTGGGLTTAEERVLRLRLPKYWRQFTETRLKNPRDGKPPHASAVTATRLKEAA